MKKQINPDMLKRLCEKGKTVREIAIETGWSTTTVATRLKQYGLKIKPVQKSNADKQKTLESGNHLLDECELALLQTMKDGNYPEERMAYMLGMSVSFLKEKGYL